MSTSNINQFKVKAEDFKIIREINRGTFGIVYEVEEKKSSKRYAGKVILGGSTKQVREMINREVQIMIRIIHPTLIGFRGFSTTDLSGNKNITIFMELVEKGSLEDVLEKVSKSLGDSDYDNTARQIILVGIAYGMMTLHQNYVIHRDLKPGNILIDKNFYPHITDFGLSKFVSSGHSKSQSKSCGTPIYMAPEVIDGERYDGKADVYSFGIIMFQVVTDTRPYPLFDNGKLKEFKFNKKIVDENYRPSFTVPVKKQIKKLIERCWAKEPKERPTFEEIFNKLAYNRGCAIYDDLNNEDEDEEEENYDDTPFYLSDVDANDLFLYLDIITENTNIKINDNAFEGIIEKLSRTVENQQKIITKMQNKQIKQFKEQEEKIENLEKLIQTQKNRIDELEKQLHKPKNEISFIKGKIFASVEKGFINAEIDLKSNDSTLDTSKSKIIISTSDAKNLGIEAYEKGEPITSLHMKTTFACKPGRYYVRCIVFNSNNVSNEIVSNSVTTSVSILTFDYEGKPAKISLPQGQYKLEVWGAKGGDSTGKGQSIRINGQIVQGGLGGYSRGILNLNKKETVYVFVGEEGRPSNSSDGSSTKGGFPDGGGTKTGHCNNYTTVPGTGGGSTSIRIGSDTNYTRVIVAGGGGGAGGDSGNVDPGGFGGGLSGGNCSYKGSLKSQGAGTQTGSTRGLGERDDRHGDPGQFGLGATGKYCQGRDSGGGGGGGWYGGGSGGFGNHNRCSSGGGGSGWTFTESSLQTFRSGDSSNSSKFTLNSSYYLTDAQSFGGNEEFPRPDGNGNEIGHTGNGFAKITPL